MTSTLMQGLLTPSTTTIDLPDAASQLPRHKARDGALPAEGSRFPFVLPHYQCMKSVHLHVVRCSPIINVAPLLQFSILPKLL